MLAHGIGTTGSTVLAYHYYSMLSYHITGSRISCVLIKFIYINVLEYLDA